VSDDIVSLRIRQVICFMAKKKASPSPEQLQRMRDTALQIEVWAKKPWRWIRDCCVTQDEADSSSPVKPFPDKEYLRYITGVWQGSSLLAIPKSRRMMLTWLMLALHLHKALFFPRSAIFIQSKKEDDSDFLLSDKRMLFIYENLPKSLPWPKVTRKFCSLEFSNGSYMRGIAQGPDQLRQYTASAILCDEMAFWDKAEQTWGALKPTVQGGGQVTMISSAGPGFFQRLVEGRLTDDRR